MSLNVLWLFLFTVPVAGQTKPHTQLESFSSALDPSSHVIQTTLINRSGKKIVAYVLEVGSFNWAGKPVGRPLTAGTDNVFSLVYGEDDPA